MYNNATEIMTKLKLEYCHESNCMDGIHEVGSKIKMMMIDDKT